VMCQICFNRFETGDLSIGADGVLQDVCKVCVGEV
jgi:hypothetical protein